ncbi:hypothetical protein [Propionivibrio dicarboxylicus]|uniref:Uncharacterized protein n=1 Tax=Propionivibrio dicarboxylicus TaxID=83767 RepID=A0A1G8AP97_9RHOO|nr:hypothetical protein [Propionivibrio dicarboxylicus]SDH22795.1 hypothetical protein SAMN05660652_01453 [Propionivibrio dicarboxylicus]
MKIPTYDTPQVEARALPGVRESSVASPALFGASAEQQVQAGKSALGAGNTIMAAAGIMQDRENADLIFRAETTLKDDYLNFEASVRERKGQNAWGATKDTEQWFAEQEKKHGEALQNDVQRKLFGQSLTKLRQSAIGTISQYEANERRRSIEESADASIVGSINMAATAAADGLVVGAGPNKGAPATTTDEDGNPIVTAPDVTVSSNPLPSIKSDIIKRVQVLSDLNGWSPERKQFEEAKHLTNLHKQVVQALADKDATKAREYFEANKAEINGGDLDSIGKVLKFGETKQAGFEFANRPDIMSLASDQDRIAAARDYFKDAPEKREAAIQEIKTRAAEAETFRQRGQRDAGDAAWKVITGGGSLGSIPAATWAAMGGEEQRQVQDYLDARTRRAEADARRDGKEEMDDIANLDKVERMIEQGDITDRAQLARYDAFFTKSTLKTLATKIDKRAVVPPADIRREFEERKGAKVNVAKMGDKDRAEWMAFQDYILQNVKETRRPEDLNVWADKWFLKGYGKDDSIFINDPNTFGEAMTKGRKDFVISTPEAAQSNVDQALSILSKNGVPMPKDKALARDEFYTKNVLDADRWAAAHGVQSTPEFTAAYALLKQNKKPITAGNLDYVIKQFKN